MKRTIGFLTLMIIAGSLWQASVYASGSFSSGQGINARSAYAMGKALTFQKLVCPSCPLQENDLTRERAMSLKNSLEARDAASKPGTADDQHIAVLCPGNRATGCDGKPDEQELVHYYLKRRFKL
ncbi:MAG: hypothetical protein OXF97_01135 [Nitrospira sp.]|nr:hypothetical protein [Nitrospira sp.]MCY4132315.1 hypothetical protein [Nitrospira sp.]